MTTKLYQVGEAAVTVADPQGPLAQVRRRIVGLPCAQYSANS